MKGVARELGNTPAVCCKCYVHPANLEHYMGGQMVKALSDCMREVPLRDDTPAGLREEEQVLLRLLGKNAA